MFHRFVKGRRIFLGTAIGVAGGVLCFFTIHHFFLYLMAIFFLVNPLMLWVTFGGKSIKTFLKQYCGSIGINLLLGGVFDFFQKITPEMTYYRLLPAICLLWLGGIFVFVIRNQYFVNTTTVSFQINGHVERMLALKDTGNVLCDPYSGCSVCVVSEERIKAWEIPEENMYQITYETINGSGKLKVYKTTYFMLEKEGEMIEQPTPMIGFGNKALFVGKKYQMILHKEYC